MSSLRKAYRIFKEEEDKLKREYEKLKREKVKS
jgi:hypothetical protein